MYVLCIYIQYIISWDQIFSTTGSFLLIEILYGAINTLFMQKTLCLKAFLFLCNNVRNSIFFKY